MAELDGDRFTDAQGQMASEDTDEIRSLLTAHNANLEFLSQNLDRCCKEDPQRYLGKFLVIGKGGNLLEALPTEKEAERYRAHLDEDVKMGSDIWYVRDRHNVLEAFAL